MSRREGSARRPRSGVSDVPRGGPSGRPGKAGVVGTPCADPSPTRREPWQRELALQVELCLPRPLASQRPRSERVGYQTGLQPGSWPQGQLRNILRPLGRENGLRLLPAPEQLADLFHEARHRNESTPNLAMRMRGLEPPRAFAHTDLNRARLPIPPHPRGAEIVAVRETDLDGVLAS